MAEHHDDEQRRAQVSAIMDGAEDPSHMQRWLSGPAQRSEAKADWHTYHLIGDVLRSQDLASTAAHDRELLERIRRGVATEPVVLAPAAAAASRAPAAARSPIRRRLWAGTAAAVAGFAVVGAAFFTTRAEFGEGPTLAWVGLGTPAEDIRRASVAAPGPSAGLDAPMVTFSGAAQQAPFREILRLPRGPAQRPMESVQVLYSNGSATISVVVEPYRQGEHVPRAESSERLNTLTVQRQDVWLTLSGDVPLGALQQMAMALPVRP